MLILFYNWLLSISQREPASLALLMSVIVSSSIWVTNHLFAGARQTQQAAQEYGSRSPRSSI